MRHPSQTSSPTQSPSNLPHLTWPRPASASSMLNHLLTCSNDLAEPDCETTRRPARRPTRDTLDPPDPRRGDVRLRAGGDTPRPVQTIAPLNLMRFTRASTNISLADWRVTVPANMPAPTPARPPVNYAHSPQTSTRAALTLTAKQPAVPGPRTAYADWLAVKMRSDPLMRPPDRSGTNEAQAIPPDQPDAIHQGLDQHPPAGRPRKRPVLTRRGGDKNFNYANQLQRLHPSFVLQHVATMTTTRHHTAARRRALMRDGTALRFPPPRIRAYGGRAWPGRSRPGPLPASGPRGKAPRTGSPMPNLSVWPPS